MTVVALREDDVRDNVYGHGKRLRWIADHIERSDRVLEFGCGTGLMLTLPLLVAGVDAMGLDTDEASIAFGRRVLADSGLDPARLVAADLATLAGCFDVVIASEVLEHIPDEHLGGVLSLLRARLHPDGRLLVTVPNGYGWFEFESWLWFRVGMGRLVESLRIPSALRRAKLALGVLVDDDPVSSLDSSPHVQRFTMRSIARLLHECGFVVEEETGTTLCSGPFADMWFRGVRPVLRLDAVLGSLLPWAASSFLIAARVEAKKALDE